MIVVVILEHLQNPTPIVEGDVCLHIEAAFSAGKLTPASGVFGSSNLERMGTGPGEAQPFEGHSEATKASGGSAILAPHFEPCRMAANRTVSSCTGSLRTANRANRQNANRTEPNRTGPDRTAATLTIADRGRETRRRTLPPISLVVCLLAHVVSCHLAV